MWQLDNRTPFAAERAWIRDREGAEVWLVAIKATFDVLPDGSTAPSQEQPQVLHVPEYFGEPGKSSIKYESDLILTKTTTDVLVAGHAYAPEGEVVTETDIGFRVGPVKKVLRVFGDRIWEMFGASAPEPFDRIPLRYERAFGGVDIKSAHPESDWEWRNPVGMGFAVSRSNAKGLTLPNFEYPNQLIRSWRDRPAPAGVGPIDRYWQPRAAFAGTYDDEWNKARHPLLPEDFDDRFYQCVPPDQQAPRFLQGGEPVSLLNLTPSGSLHFVLPTLRFNLETRFYDGTWEFHKSSKLHSVILEPDFPRFSLVWHSALSCHFKVYKLERTRITLELDSIATGRKEGVASLEST